MTVCFVASEANQILHRTCEPVIEVSEAGETGCIETRLAENHIVVWMLGATCCCTKIKIELI